MGILCQEFWHNTIRHKIEAFSDSRKRDIQFHATQAWDERSLACFTLRNTFLTQSWSVSPLILRVHTDTIATIETPGSTVQASWCVYLTELINKKK